MDDYSDDTKNYQGVGWLRSWEKTQVGHATINGEPSLILHCPLKEGFDGDASVDGIASVIRIEDGLRGREYMETLIHEFLHVVMPSASEDWVTQSARELSELIYSADCRRRSGLS